MSVPEAIDGSYDPFEEFNRSVVDRWRALALTIEES